MYGPPISILGCRMRVLTWNINQFGGDRTPQEELITLCMPDVVMLQEVKGWYVRRLREQWDGPVVSGTDYHPDSTPHWITSVILLPSGTDVVAAGPINELPRPQRAVWADVVLPKFGAVHLVSWHNENAATDQRRKMAAFRAASAHLRSTTGPVILGVDLNTWRDPGMLQFPDTDPFFDEHRICRSGPRSRAR